MSALINAEAAKEHNQTLMQELTETKAERIESMLYTVMNGGALRYRSGDVVPFLDLEAAFNSVLENGEIKDINDLAAMVAKSCYDDNQSIKEMLSKEAEKLIEEHYQAIVDYQFETTYQAA